MRRPPGLREGGDVLQGEDAGHGDTHKVARGVDFEGKALVHRNLVAARAYPPVKAPRSGHDGTHGGTAAMRASPAIGVKCSVLDLDVAGADRFQREVGRAGDLAGLGVAHRVRIVVPEEGAADLVAAVAGLTIVLDGEENGTEEA